MLQNTYVIKEVDQLSFVIIFPGHICYSLVCITEHYSSHDCHVIRSHSCSSNAVMDIISSDDDGTIVTTNSSAVRGASSCSTIELNCSTDRWPNRGLGGQALSGRFV